MRFVRLCAATAILVVLCPLNLGAQEQGCLPPDDGARATLHYAVTLATASDVDTARDRDAYGILPADSSDVVLITDDAVCERFAEAYAEHVYESQVTGDSKTDVHVIRIGSRFLVWDPSTATPESEFELFLVFDEDGKEVGGFVG